MKVVLARPPFYSLFGYKRFGEPLSLLSLAAVLRENGHEPIIVDGELIGMKYYKQRWQDKLSPLRMMPGQGHAYYNAVNENSWAEVWDRTVRAIIHMNSDVIGLTTFTAGMTGIKHICKYLRYYYPMEEEVPIILGGVHATALPNETVAETGGIVVIGEGEQSILTALECDPVDGPGIYNPPIEDLNTLPYPARDLLYNYNNIYNTNIITSRGCPFHCNFCASHTLWGRKVRYRHPEHVLGEVAELVHKYGVTRFRFCDDTFTINKKHVLDICDGLTDINVRFTCGSRVDTLDEWVVEALKRAGCFRVSLGIESGNDNILKLIGKGTTTDQARHAVGLLKEADIETCAYFMVGHPWDHQLTIQDSINLMKELDPERVEVSVVTPYPGTDLWEMYHEEVKDIPWYKFFHQGEALTGTQYMTREEVTKEYVRAYQIFARHVMWKETKRRLLGR